MIALFGVGLGALVFLWARRLHGDRAAAPRRDPVRVLPDHARERGPGHERHDRRLHVPGGGDGVLGHGPPADAGAAPPLRPHAGAPLRRQVLRPARSPRCAPSSSQSGSAGPERSSRAGPSAADRRTGPRVALALVGATLAACALAVAVIWASYGFRYAMFQQVRAQPRALARRLGRARGPGGADSCPSCASPAPTSSFPSPTSTASRTPTAFSRYRKAFLNGDYRSTGWVQFFPYTTAVKTPLALFGLIALAGPARSPAQSRRVAEAALRVVPAPLALRVYWAFSLTSGLNIGHRHIIPVYPVLFVMAAGAAAWARAAAALDRRPRRSPSSSGSRPNPSGSARTTSPTSTSSSGRATHGGTWSTARSTGARTCRPSRHGSTRTPRTGPCSSPTSGRATSSYYGIKGTRSATPTSTSGRGRSPSILKGGLWIISVTQFQQVYTEARGPWDREKEALPGAPRARARARETKGGKLTYQEGVNSRSTSSPGSAITCGAKPLAEPGYTFLIFRLTDAEVMRALYEPLPDP
jgi:hypothetical protein